MSGPSPTPPFGAHLAGRRVLVTGHTGFKGAWLAMWLHRLGAVVTGYALDPGEPNLYQAARVERMVATDIRADVRDVNALQAAVQQTRPDVIFHLAAQPLVRLAWHEPAETFEVNVMGTVNVLEAVRRSGRPCVVIVVTSDKCYANPGLSAPFRESDRLGGSEAYGASKAAAELVVESYRRTYFPPERSDEHGVRVASVRAGNVIGGGDWAPDRIIPDIVRSLAAGRVVKIRRPEATRPWQHVTVPLSGYLHVASRMLAGGAEAERACAGWNFGPPPGDELPVDQLVQMAVSIWGGGAWEHVVDPLAGHEATTLRLDTSRALRLLGWSPAWPLAESLRRTLDWYKLWVADPAADMGPSCLADIEAYEDAAGSPAGGAERPLTAASLA